MAIELKYTDEDVERLAAMLGVEYAWDLAYGDNAFGWPDPDNEAEMGEAARVDEYHRDRARRYLKAAFGEL